MEEHKTAIYLSDDEARLFIELQKHYSVIAPIVGYLDTLQLVNLSNTSIQLDVDMHGKIAHTSITKHFRT